MDAVVPPSVIVVFILLCAQGLCNMSLQPGRYSLVEAAHENAKAFHECENSNT
jgi:hypothetical protein